MHKPTWELLDHPSHLIAALACLGSTSYHKKQGLDEESILLAEICLHHLNRTVSRVILVRQALLILHPIVSTRTIQLPEH
jgi:hypothetical protein